jgi:hypothetical protein
MLVPAFFYLDNKLTPTATYQPKIEETLPIRNHHGLTMKITITKTRLPSTDPTRKNNTKTNKKQETNNTPLPQCNASQVP